MTLKNVFDPKRSELGLCYVCGIKHKPEDIVYSIMAVYAGIQKSNIAGVTYCIDCWNKLAGKDFMFDLEETNEKP